MRSLRRWGTRLAAALLAVSASAHSAGLVLSGTVFDMSSKPLSGVVVQLVQAGLSTTTDASGAWSLGSAIGITKRPALPVGSGRLQVEDGRISIRFSGHDLLGRGQGAQAKPAAGPNGWAARSAAILDTVSYTWNGKVRLRDTVSVSQAGIVRFLDTNVNAGIVYGYLTDGRNGQTYRTVTIGTRTWMAQNLNYKVDSSWWYDNSADNGAKYGRLYTWAAAMGLNDSCNTKSCASQVTAERRGVCPVGWHVPSDAEWNKLTDTTLAAATAGTKLKATIGWADNGNGTDDYGFSVLPAGERYNDGSFNSLGDDAYFWSATEDAGSGAWGRNFPNGNASVCRNSYYFRSVGYSLRCLQD